MFVGSVSLPVLVQPLQLQRQTAWSNPGGQNDGAANYAVGDLEFELVLMDLDCARHKGRLLLDALLWPASLQSVSLWFVKLVRLCRRRRR